MLNERKYGHKDEPDASGLTEQEREKLASLLVRVENDTESMTAKRLRFALHLVKTGRISEWGIAQHDD